MLSSSEDGPVSRSRRDSDAGTAILSGRALLHDQGFPFVEPEKKKLNMKKLPRARALCTSRWETCGGVPIQVKSGEQKDQVNGG